MYSEPVCKIIAYFDFSALLHRAANYNICITLLRYRTPKLFYRKVTNGLISPAVREVDSKVFSIAFKRDVSV